MDSYKNLQYVFILVLQIFLIGCLTRIFFIFLQCAGEQCYIADREMCSEGHECRQEDGLRGSDRPGTCVEIYHRNSRPHGSMTVVNRPVSCREECASARCAPVDHCRCGTVFHDRCKCCPSCQKVRTNNYICIFVYVMSLSPS